MKQTFLIFIFSFSLILINGQILAQTENPKQETLDEYIDRKAEEYKAEQRQKEHEKWVEQEEKESQRQHDKWDEEERERREKLLKIKEEQQEEIDRQRGYHNFNRDNEPNEEERKKIKEGEENMAACAKGAVLGGIGGAKGGVKGVAVGAGLGCAAGLAERKMNQGESKNCNAKIDKKKKYTGDPTF